MAHCEERYSPCCSFTYARVNKHKQKQNLAQCWLEEKKKKDKSVLVAARWLTMTNTLNCGYSLGTKPLSSLNRVGRITLILFLPLWQALLLGLNRTWVTVLSVLPGNRTCSLKYSCGQARASVEISVLVYVSSPSCIWLTYSSVVRVMCWRSNSHDSLLSLTGRITNQTLFVRASVWKWPFVLSILPMWGL